jgi:hypothetical protein
MWKQIEAGGLGAAFRPPMGPGQSPGGGSGGDAPGNWRVFSISDTASGISRKEIYLKIIRIPTFKMLISAP